MEKLTIIVVISIMAISFGKFIFTIVLLSFNQACGENDNNPKNSRKELNIEETCTELSKQNQQLLIDNKKLSKQLKIQLCPKCQSPLYIQSSYCHKCGFKLLNPYKF